MNQWIGRKIQIHLSGSRRELFCIGYIYFLAFKRRLAYNGKTNKVAKSLLGLYYMPARTLNDFFAGFFVSAQSRYEG
jgi:hypothetical protein